MIKNVFHSVPGSSDEIFFYFKAIQCKSVYNNDNFSLKKIE